MLVISSTYTLALCFISKTVILLSNFIFITIVSCFNSLPFFDSFLVYVLQKLSMFVWWVTGGFLFNQIIIFILRLRHFTCLSSFISFLVIVRFFIRVGILISWFDGWNLLSLEFVAFMCYCRLNLHRHQSLSWP